VRRCRQAIVVVAIAAALVALPPAAWARFTTARLATTTVSSASLSAPSALSTSKRCTFLGIGGDSLTVDWAASPTSSVTGYVLELNANLGTDITRTISGRSTTSATVSVTAGTTYTITVSSAVQNWTATSSAVSAGCGLFG
jgi:Fibronectin type III domain